MGTGISDCMHKLCDGSYSKKKKVSSLIHSSHHSEHNNSIHCSSHKSSIAKPAKDNIHQDKFQILQVLGEGSVSKVYMVKLKGSDEIYAMKSINKKQMSNEDANDAIITEKQILNIMNNPFIPKLHFQFENDKKLFFVMEFLEGGSLAQILSQLTRFSEEITRFYAAEIIVALNYLHSQGIMYRDLRTRNIMLDAEGHIRLADFGLAKIGECQDIGEDAPINPVYMAPEILIAQKHDYRVDFWSLGCIIFEFLTGKVPYDDPSHSREKIHQKIINTKINWSDIQISKNAKDLISRLLILEPSQRLGAQGIEELMKHSFFNGVKWDKVKTKSVYPLLVPSQYKTNIENDDEDPVEYESSSTGSLGHIPEDQDNEDDENNVEAHSFKHVKWQYNNNIKQNRNEENQSLNTTNTSN